jgi:hypothetical protein
MTKTEMYEKLAGCVLPKEIAESFDMVDLQELGTEMHIYLDEKEIAPPGYKFTEVSPNGFYEMSCIQDFPIRDRRVKLYVRRRRWKVKATGKSVSKDWDLVAKGTRHSKEFAAFLKGMLGEIPDYGPLA